jgi:2-polyprenyl-6-methoxyphenol hydroxylase-like FAD-dependent oxidoreductase
MTQRLMRVCVVGAGLAGLACALAAASRGLQVQVFEEASQPHSASAHIEVVPNMLRGLVALGVGDDCVRAGFAYHGIDVLDRQGRHLHALPTERLAGARFPAALGIRHADLHQLLERAAIDRGAVVRRGSRVQAVHQRGDAATVELADGESAAADLVLLAAGAGSALRTACFPDAQPASVLDQAWWYAALPRPVDLDRPLVAFGNGGQRAVLVPVRPDLAGIALIGPPPAQRTLSPAGHLREALASFAPRVRKLASHFGEGTPVVLRTARSGLLDLPWHHGAVLAVGECAHALPPHFGQAAAQAIEDAQVLADLLGHAPDRANLQQAFQQRRAARVRQVHDMTTTAAHWDLRPQGDADLSQLMGRLMRTVAEPA